MARALPDEALGLEDGYAAPEARYEQREGVELAFIAALQHLPANQRAVLILREVLGFSAAETAEALDTTVASVNSALQRARKAVDGARCPSAASRPRCARSATTRCGRSSSATWTRWGARDVDAVVAMLAEDAAWSMPPLASWFGGLDRGARVPRARPAVGRVALAPPAGAANGQPAVAVYHWDEAAGAHLPFALDVLTLDGDRDREITAFITRTTELDDFSRWPEAPLDGRLAFERFGLPAQVG